MKKLNFASVLVTLVLLLLLACCKNKIEKPVIEAPVPTNTLEVSFDSTQIAAFFEKYPKLKLYQNEVEQLYRKHQFRYIWFDEKGLNEFSGLLYNKVNNLSADGIETTIPYKERFDFIYQNPFKNQKASVDTELLSSSLYFFIPIKFLKELTVRI